MYHIKRAMIFRNLKIFHLLASNPCPVVRKQQHFSIDTNKSNSSMKSHPSSLMGSILKNYLKNSPMHSYGGKSIFGASKNRTCDRQSGFPNFSQVRFGGPLRKKIGGIYIYIHLLYIDASGGYINIYIDMFIYIYIGY